MDESKDSAAVDWCNPQSADVWAGIRRIAAAMLDDVESMAEVLVPRLLASIPSYQKTPLEELRAAAVTNMRRMLVNLAEGRLLGQNMLAENEAVIEARVRQGLPLEAILEALRIGGQFVGERLVSDARREEVDPEAILAATQLLWSGADASMTWVAVSYRRSELAMVRHDQQRQSDFLRALLFGELDEAELSTLAPAFGLNVDRPHICFRARATERVSLEQLQRAVSSALPDMRTGLLGIVHGDLAGVLPDTPRVPNCTATIGVGPPQRLSSISSSFLLASRALETALAFELTGVFRVEDVALRAAVLAEDKVGDCLVDQYLRPLAAEKRAAELLESTLREFLDRGMRVDKTAQALFIHPNTLRNRLHRIEQLTGARFDCIDDVVGIWWALERRRIGSRTDQS